MLTWRFPEKEVPLVIIQLILGFSMNQPATGDPPLIEPPRRVDPIASRCCRANW